ncbi:MAG: SRPBCC family protein [Chryseobacterium sp.]|uniref:SRPBCC family protein n=1 Tax=Chryseobacterium sp. TaxID=1871047 RepID=UPI003D0E0980
MKSQDFTTSITVDAAPQQVFDAINNVRGWWSENIEGSTSVLNSEFAYHYRDVHRCRIKITEMQPNTRVMWHVLDNNFNFIEDKTEWVDTHIVFDIHEKEGKTELTFTHQGLVPEGECYEVCHDAWTHYIQDSLKSLITTGQGKATPKEDFTVSDHPEENTDTKSIYHRLLITVPVEKVYEAITTQEGLAGWWTPDTEAKAEIGSMLRFGFGPDYFKKMEVVDLKPYSLVKWRCIKGFEDWVGTTLTFELEPHKKGCVLLFHHDGWKSYNSEFASCSFDWALFFRSLKSLCETGKGFPYPEFDKIN